MDSNQFEAKFAAFQQQVTDLIAATVSDHVVTGFSFCNPDTCMGSFELLAPLSYKIPETGGAELHVNCKITLDRTDSFLSTHSSSYGVRFVYGPKKKRKVHPIVRFEYLRDSQKRPSAHIHVSSNSPALAMLLERNKQSEAGFEQQNLHYPTGGHHFRVCLEDVIQFCITELGFMGKSGWQMHVEAGRQEFLKHQINAVVKQDCETAAEVLRQLGYEVSSPQNQIDLPGRRPGW